MTRNSPYLLKIRVYSVGYPHVKILWSVLIFGKMRHTYLNWYHSCLQGLVKVNPARRSEPWTVFLSATDGKTAQAGQADWLSISKKQFGTESIFMDIDTIQPGIDFTEAPQKAVSSCEVLLAMIGPEWTTVTGKSGKPRIEDPSDWVRTEIAAALKRKIRVIPVLVGGASVPTIDLLPDDLDALAQRQAHELTDKRWSFDVEQLINTLPAARQRPPTQLEATPTASNTGQFKWVMIGVLTVTLR
ncbi:MAG: toll/interleukin-1 receptor domain-containing protein [Nitrospirota bacterium]